MAGSPPSTVPDLQYTYTTRGEMDSLFSQMGVTLRAQDQQSTQSETIIIEDIIDEATETINDYCIAKYYPEDLQNSRWVRRQATVLACYFLSTRRGNPAQFKQRRKDAIDRLEMIQKTTNSIPGLPWRGEFILPQADNITVDHRFIRTGSKIREVPVPPWDAI